MVNENTKLKQKFIKQKDFLVFFLQNVLYICETLTHLKIQLKCFVVAVVCLPYKIGLGSEGSLRLNFKKILLYFYINI